MVKSVAIACQGGGSHTAFTAGALKRILEEKDGRFNIVAFTGTSGGAECALLAWYGLLTAGKDEAIKLLDSFWNDLSVNLPEDLKFMNAWGVLASQSPYIPKVSPYYPPASYWAERTQGYLRKCLEKYVDFDKIEKKYSLSIPELVVGATNVKTGEFEVFKSNKKYRTEGKENAGITAEAILASAAESSFLQAVHIDGNVYWDGLFSQNPPIHDILDKKNASEKPDQIWVIRINPQKRSYEPKSPKEIEDRRNELAGNISLNHELHLIDTLNKLVDDLPKNSEYKKKYKRIEVPKPAIEMTKEDLPVASKGNLDPKFIREMMDDGWREAGRFLDSWQT